MFLLNICLGVRLIKNVLSEKINFSALGGTKVNKHETNHDIPGGSMPANVRTQCKNKQAKKAKQTSKLFAEQSWNTWWLNAKKM